MTEQQRQQQGNDAVLSRLLFEVREELDMWADVTEARMSQPATSTRELITRIDEYRAARGWSPDGFGGEDGGR
jgi:hypothetical protein